MKLIATLLMGMAGTLALAVPPSEMSVPHRMSANTLVFKVRNPAIVQVRASGGGSVNFGEARAWCTGLSPTKLSTCKVPGFEKGAEVRVCDAALANCLPWMAEARVGCTLKCGAGDCPDFFLRSTTFTPDLPQPVPVEPTDLTATGKDAWIELTWRDNSCNELYFRVELKRSDSPTWVDVAHVPADYSCTGCTASFKKWMVNSERVYSDTGPRGGQVPPQGLTMGMVYTFRVSAWNASGTAAPAVGTSVLEGQVARK